MKRLFIIVFIALVCMSNSDCDGQREQRVYEVVEKSKDVGSHYNFFTEKQVVETVYYVIMKDAETGELRPVECSASSYYKFNVGKRYRLSRREVELGHYYDY